MIVALGAGLGSTGRRSRVSLSSESRMRSSWCNSATQQHSNTTPIFRDIGEVYYSSRLTLFRIHTDGKLEFSTISRLAAAEACFIGQLMYNASG
jgi:hypothetical protein